MALVLTIALPTGFLVAGLLAGPAVALGMAAIGLGCGSG